ncbi:Transposase domain [Nitrosomonas cryotolerans]|nr:Transposase domain [Nitrosomonas cryotolerans]
MNNLSGDRLKYPVWNHLSFMWFLEFDLTEIGPDTKTMWVWEFREELKKNHLLERLFVRFDACLRALDVELKSDQIIGAAFVAVLRQRNTCDKNKIIREGPFRLNGGITSTNVCRKIPKHVEQGRAESLWLQRSRQCRSRHQADNRVENYFSKKTSACAGRTCVWVDYE